MEESCEQTAQKTKRSKYWHVMMYIFTLKILELLFFSYWVQCTDTAFHTRTDFSGSQFPQSINYYFEYLEELYYQFGTGTNFFATQNTLLLSLRVDAMREAMLCPKWLLFTPCELCDRFTHCHLTTGLTLHHSSLRSSLASPKASEAF
jgi:hypothetical protein